MTPDGLRDDGMLGEVWVTGACQFTGNRTDLEWEHQSTARLLFIKRLNVKYSYFKAAFHRMIPLPQSACPEPGASCTGFGLPAFGNHGQHAPLSAPPQPKTSNRLL